jgi:hypothetical protein
LLKNQEVCPFPGKAGLNFFQNGIYADKERWAGFWGIFSSI